MKIRFLIVIVLFWLLFSGYQGYQINELQNQVQGLANSVYLGVNYDSKPLFSGWVQNGCEVKWLNEGTQLDSEDSFVGEAGWWKNCPKISSTTSTNDWEYQSGRFLLNNN